MGTLAEKLSYLSDTKSAIRTAIGSDSITDDTPFRNYASVITDKLNNVAYQMVIGSSLSITDAINAKFDSIKIFGKSTQTSTSGANLFDASSYTANSTTNGTTTVENDVVHFINTSGTSYSITYTIPLHAGTYYLSTQSNVITDTCTYILRVNGASVSGWLKVDSTDYSFTVSDGDVVTLVLTTTSSKTVGEWYTKVMIASSSGLAWEPYTGGIAAPNPSYPQDIISLDCTSAALTFAGTELALPDVGEFRGVPVDSGGNFTDSDGQQWICDYVDLIRGVYVQYCVVYDNFGTNASYDTTNMTYYRQLNADVAGNTNAAGKTICTMLAASKYEFSTNNKEHFYINPNTGTCTIYIDNTIDADTVIANLKVIGTLSTPIVTPLTEAQLEAFKNLYTSTDGTAITNSMGADMQVIYLKR